MLCGSDNPGKLLGGNEIIQMKKVDREMHITKTETQENPELKRQESIKAAQKRWQNKGRKWMLWKPKAWKGKEESHGTKCSFGEHVSHFCRGKILFVLWWEQIDDYK